MRNVPVHLEHPTFPLLSAPVLSSCSFPASVLASVLHSVIVLASDQRVGEMNEVVFVGIVVQMLLSMSVGERKTA